MTDTGLILTGASGALGLSFLQLAIRRWPQLRIVCLLRSTQAMDAVRAEIGPAPRVEFLRADLTDPGSMAAATETLYGLSRVIGVHAAADVAWDRSAEEMAPLNVEGSLRFLDFLRMVAAEPRMIYLSTAYTQTEDWEYRNGYEITKAEAERKLRARCGDIPFSTFACSLVVGDSETGRICRYNGIYPILKFLSELAPPFLVGNRNAQLDLVPVDWVCGELLALCQDHLAALPPRDVIASAGPARRIGFERVVRIGEAGIARFDARLSLSSAEPTPVVSGRQWAFLKRCLKTWEPPDISVSDFRYFERLLQVYGTYAEDDRVRDPQGTLTAAPDPEQFLPRAVDRWLEDHEARLVSRRRRIARAMTDA